MSESEPETPRGVYRSRLDLRRAAEARQERRHRRIADARLAAFLAIVAAGWAAFAGWASPAWIALPVTGLAALVVWHAFTTRARDRSARAVSVYDKALARVEGRWAGQGEPGTEYRSPDHPYADDLDLFGVGSLFERLCVARTRAGRDVLAGWLLKPAWPEEVRARQEAVEELRPRVDFREDVSIMGTDRAVGVEFAALSAWGDAPIRLNSTATRVLSLLLAVGAAILLSTWLYVGGYPSIVLWPIVAAEVVVSFWHRRRVREVSETVEAIAEDLGLLAGLMARVEREPFHSPKLAAIRAVIDSADGPPSRRIAELGSLADLLAATHNVYFALLAPPLLWKTQVAYAVESWRAKSGRSIAGWLAAVAEVEALSSLSAYAFENPGDPFPELSPSADAYFRGEAVGHPLLDPARCVANDVQLGGELRALIVSGSNMSGKTTLLRSIGINAVLAQAGAPVRAKKLELSPLSVGSTLRIQDSLQDGKSRFYAEITRLKALIDVASGPRPLLFLLDEILHGTNSLDRRLGAESILRGLIDRGSIGLITTHDLALAAAADALAPRVANVHFSDELVDGVMHFDYAMRPGIVGHSNALALMRAVGLEV